MQPESLILPGSGIDRYSLLHGDEARTRVVTLADDGAEKEFIIVGGNDLNDGTTPGERPPLIINPAKYRETDGKEGIAVLPYGSQTLRQENGVFAGEEFVLGSPDNPRSFGKVTRIDHVPLPHVQPEPLSQEEAAIQASFAPYEPIVTFVTNLYNDAPAQVVPPDVLP